MSQLKVKRCGAAFGGGECGSAVFYDWGLQVLDESAWNSVATGEVQDRYKGFATATSIKICARCTTPYILEAGDLIDIGDELSAEDVKAILSRGQATLPHVKVKDP